MESPDLRSKTSTTVPTGSRPQSRYARQYFEAIDLFNGENFNACIELLKSNLTNPTLPRYYRIKSLLLIASAEEDWYSAERCRIEAGDFWSIADRLTARTEEAALAALGQLRIALDALATSQREEAPEVVDERLLVPDFDEDAMAEEEEDEGDVEEEEVEGQIEEDGEREVEDKYEMEVDTWGCPARARCSK